MYYLFAFLLFLVPKVSVASQHRDFKFLVESFLGIINALIPIILGLTVIVFMWGIVKAWILNPDDTKSIEDGKTLAIWGIVILAVMFGIWGILELLQSTLFAF